MRHIIVLFSLSSSPPPRPQRRRPHRRIRMPPATPLSAPVYVLSGGGYGHGVGLNQYGALGQAKASRSYQDILAFYYPGTTLAKAADHERARAARRRAPVGRRSARPSPFTVTDASGTVTPLPAGEVVLKPDLKLAVAGKPKALPGPLSFAPAKGTTLTLDGKGYRGELRATAIAKGLQIVDTVALDQYLLGVVPGEMPKEWPAAALQAQAVAARSYALASIVKNRDFDLYADPRSQMYYGVAAESPTTTAAVKATKGQVLTYAGKVVTTFYYSSSGGRTASSEDVFGLALPYLQSRPDPWDTRSPYHRWEPRSFTATSLAAGFRPLGSGRRRRRRADGFGPAGVGDAGQEDRREDPAQGGRRSRPAGPPLDGVQARRAPRRPPAGSLGRRQARRRLGARARRAERRCSRSSSPTAPGFRPSRSPPPATARSPSPCGRRSRRRTASPPTDRSARR